MLLILDAQLLFTYCPVLSMKRYLCLFCLLTSCLLRNTFLFAYLLFIVILLSNRPQCAVSTSSNSVWLSALPLSAAVCSEWSQSLYCKSDVCPCDVTTQTRHARFENLRLLFVGLRCRLLRRCVSSQWRHSLFICAHHVHPVCCALKTLKNHTKCFSVT